MATLTEQMLEFVPSLADAPEDVQKAYTEMYAAMTVPPKGMDPKNWRWSPDVVKIRHKMTSDTALPEEAAVGDIWSANKVLWSVDDNGKKDPYRFVPFKRWISHARFPKGAQRPTCSSMDGETGYDENGTQIACDTCPVRPWAGGQKQECQRSQNYYVFDVDNVCIRMINFSKSNFKAGSVIVDVSSKKRALWDTVFGLTTKELNTGDYTYPVYVVREVETQEEPWVAEFCDHAYDMMTDRRQASIQRMEERALTADAALSGAAPALEDLDAEDEVDGFDDM